jgi:hypothetical protein
MPTEAFERKLVAILAASVAGHSRLMSDGGPWPWREHPLSAARRSRLRDICSTGAAPYQKTGRARIQRKMAKALGIEGTGFASSPHEVIE